jgi:glycosyltransferase involved in cell wall biosynthesis
MKIGLIAYGLDRPLTGMGRYTVELARALRRMKDGPELFIFSGGSIGPLENEGFPLVPLPACRQLSALMTVGNFWISLQARRQKMDLVHDPCGVAPFLFGAGNAGMVVTLHDVIPYIYPQTSSLTERIIYQWWLPRLLPEVDAVLTGSRHSREDIRRFLNVRDDRLFMVPYGVSDQFRPVSGDGSINTIRMKYSLAGPYVLYMGDFTPRKNLHRLLEAFLSLRSRLGKFSLVLAGSRMNQKANIEPVIQWLRMGDCVRIIGPVPEADLPALYAGADLFVFPSLYEGFGFPPLEAMACGVPVISSGVASLPEVVGDAVISVNPYRVDSLAEAMRKMLTRPDLRRTMTEKGYEQAKKFSWDRTAKETMDVYRTVEGSRHSR